MLWKMVGMKLRKLGSKLLGNVKLTQKAKRLTRFCLLLQPYLIFQPLTIVYGFPDYLFHFFTIYFAAFHHGSQYLTSFLLSLSIVIALPPHQNFGSYFLVFGKCGVTPNRLYRDSLTLINYKYPNQDIKKSNDKKVFGATLIILVSFDAHVTNVFD